MKRILLPGLYTLLAGAFTLILLASVFYSCRSGGDPHHTRSSRAEYSPSETAQAAPARRAAIAGTRDVTACLRSRL